jgi:hypothetical protein
MALPVAADGRAAGTCNLKLKAAKAASVTVPAATSDCQWQQYRSISLG